MSSYDYRAISLCSSIAGAENAEESLSQEQERNTDVVEQLEKLQEQYQMTTSRLEDLSRKEKDMKERLREQVCTCDTLS